MELFPLHGQSQPVILKDPGVPKDVVDLVDTFDGLTVGHGLNSCSLLCYNNKEPSPCQWVKILNE